LRITVIDIWPVSIHLRRTFNIIKDNFVVFDITFSAESSPLFSDLFLLLIKKQWRAKVAKNMSLKGSNIPP